MPGDPYGAMGTGVGTRPVSWLANAIQQRQGPVPQGLSYGDRTLGESDIRRNRAINTDVPPWLAHMAFPKQMPSTEGMSLSYGGKTFDSAGIARNRQNNQRNDFEQMLPPGMSLDQLMLAMSQPNPQGQMAQLVQLLLRNQQRTGSMAKGRRGFPSVGPQTGADIPPWLLQVLQRGGR